MGEIRARLPANTAIEIWWQDEARVGQKTMLTRRWARRGSRPTALRDQRTKSAYIFGAICPARGVGAGLVLPRCNTQAMQWHLDEISALVTPGAHAVLIIDRAGWHTTGRLEIPSNITLMFLPPRAPELNPVENIWQFMRDNWLSNRIFKTYDDIVALCCEAWNRLIDQPWKIMSRKVKLVPVKGFRKREIARGAKRWLAPGSEVLTDGLRCWNALDGVVGSHRVIRTGSGRQAARMAPFKWVNTTLGNTKSAITGTYRKLGPDHAQRYLASFAWRYNRRYQLNTMIPRFVHSAARNQPMPYRLLIAGLLSGINRKQNIEF